MARKTRSHPRKPSSTRTRHKGESDQADQLPSPGDLVEAFRHASSTQRALLIAGGLVVLGTSPYWGPVVWRSKRVRSLVTAGAGMAFNRFLG